MFNESVWKILATFAEAIMNGARFYDTLKTPEINVGCQLSASENKTNKFQDCSVSYKEEFYKNESK